VLAQSQLPTKRIVTVSRGYQSVELYWILPGTNLIVGMGVAGFLKEYSSKFFVARGAESRDAPFLSTHLVAEDLVDQFVRQMESGPFALIGFSSAGWIAQHVAVLLDRLGVPASHLVMIDPPLSHEAFTSSAPPEPGLLMRAREGLLLTETPHEADVALLNLQLFGLRNHTPTAYRGSSLVIMRKDAPDWVTTAEKYLDSPEIAVVEADHLELMQNPAICGPIIRKFLHQ
jgi:thioesterase domain-containing protein